MNITTIKKTQGNLCACGFHAKTYYNDTMCKLCYLNQLFCPFCREHDSEKQPLYSCFNEHVQNFPKSCGKCWENRPRVLPYAFPTRCLECFQTNTDALNRSMIYNGQKDNYLTVSCCHRCGRIIGKFEDVFTTLCLPCKRYYVYFLIQDQLQVKALIKLINEYIFDSNILFRIKTFHRFIR